MSAFIQRALDDHACLDLVFNDRLDRCLNLLSRVTETDRLPDGTREWCSTIIHAAEQSIRPRVKLAATGWRHTHWHLRQARKLVSGDEARDLAVGDMMTLALRAAADPACPAAVGHLLQAWVDEMGRRFGGPGHKAAEPGYANHAAA